MKELLRDSIFGKCVRFVTRQKYFQYPEESDSSIWKQYIDPDKSGNQALRTSSLPTQSGTDRGESDDERKNSTDPEKPRDGSDSESPAPAGGNQDNAAAENGRDLQMVDWYGPDDPDVSHLIQRYLRQTLTLLAEPAELVHVQEVLCHFHTLSLDL